MSRHYFERLVTDPAQMTDLPKAGREDLVAGLLPPLLTPIRTLSADDGATLKQVHRLHDGAMVESVLMRYPGRVTMCISSQAGCGMNCPFCATGQAGLTRNLSTAEIVEQVVAAARTLRHGDLAAAPEGGDGEAGEGSTQEALRVSNVVFMGMGEALANYKAAIGAIGQPGIGAFGARIEPAQHPPIRCRADRHRAVALPRLLDRGQRVAARRQRQRAILVDGGGQRAGGKAGKDGG